MFCTKCGSQIENGDKFCVKCGTSVAAMQQAVGAGTTVLGQESSNSTRRPAMDETIVLTEDMNPLKDRMNSGNFQRTYQQQNRTQIPPQNNQSGGRVYKQQSTMPQQHIQMESVPQQYVQPYNQMPQQAIQPQQPKKRKKKGVKIAVIVIALLALIGVGIFIAQKVLDKNSENPKRPAYTTGRIENGVYINEWADIQLEMKDDWSISQMDMSSSGYAMMKNADCAFKITNDIGENAILCFAPVIEGTTAEKALEDTERDLINNLGLEMLVSSGCYEEEFAGKTYTICDISYQTQGVYVAQRMAVCIQDDKMIIFVISVVEDSELLELLSEITRVK